MKATTFAMDGMSTTSPRTHTMTEIDMLQAMQDRQKE